MKMFSSFQTQYEFRILSLVFNRRNIKLFLQLNIIFCVLLIFKDKVNLNLSCEFRVY